jgi:SSS family solute:Na+ symporter
MSALAGVFNASSSLFTMDFYSNLGQKRDSIGENWSCCYCCNGIIGLLWIPVIQGAKGLYDCLGIQAYWHPDICCVLLWVFMKRLNGPGCLATLLTGL